MNLRSLLSWAGVSVAGLILAWLLLALPFRETFQGLSPWDDWSQFKPDLFRLFLAIAAGVPVGLSLNRVAQRCAQVKEDAEQTRRLGQTLTALVDEIKFNLDIFDSVTKRTNDPGTYVPFRDCRTQYWNRVTNDLRVLEHPILMDRLATTYYFAEAVNLWRRHLRENFASTEYSTSTILAKPDHPEIQVGMTAGQEVRERL